MNIKIPAYMFISEGSGDLHDTRRIDWASNPLRKRFVWHYSKIENASQLVSCIRAGEYAFPGGYRLAFITLDGGILSFAAVKDNLRATVDSIRHKIDDGWQVVGLIDVDNQDGVSYCDHTGEKLGGYEEQADE